MTILQLVAAVVLTLTAALTYVNRRSRLPPVAGIILQRLDRGTRFP